MAGDPGRQLATFNYAGHTTGALLAATISDLGRKFRRYRIGRVLAVLSTGAMGLTDDLYTCVALRVVAGLWMWLFIGAYCCAGFGYVISATFIVAIVNKLPMLADKGRWVWLIVGRAFPANPAKAMARMPPSYGIAQIVAPTMAGYIATGSHDGAPVAATGVMGLGMLFLFAAGGPHSRGP